MKHCFLFALLLLSSSSALFSKSHHLDLSHKGNTKYSVDTIPFAERNKLFSVSFGFELPEIIFSREISAGVLFYKNRLYLGIGTGYNSYASTSGGPPLANILPIYVSSKLMFDEGSFLPKTYYRKSLRTNRNLISAYVLIDAGWNIVLKDHPNYKRGGWLLNVGVGYKSNFGSPVNLFGEGSIRISSIEIIDFPSMDSNKEERFQILFRIGLMVTLKGRQ
ncbi:MAG: hypothetical protein MRY78_12255 [Saprospiraceae bacterium]|nr:hypothetical protein [Saprospiraceae bacterium]